VQPSVTSRPKSKIPDFHSLPDSLEDDPRWGVAKRIVVGPYFARSPLLSKFLLHIVSETLAGRQDEITEHQIGVQVFGRPAGYLTTEDNIVRNYARQLRKRLAEHFAAEGSCEPLRIEIPSGGYIPVFTNVSDAAEVDTECKNPSSLKLAAELTTAPAAPITLQVTPEIKQRHWVWRSLPLAVCATALVCATWFIAARVYTPRQAFEPMHPLWAALFGGPANSYIVPADAGFNILEDLSGRPLPLGDYLKGGYLELPLGQVDTHSADDLRSQRFTSFVDLQIVAALARRPEFNPDHVILRFPRDLRLDDLKNANAVIIGSVGSNPWASITEESANFRIDYRKDMQGAAVVNLKPQSGEASTYASHWDQSAHETFAVISYLPNLGGTGHLLLLQGLDVAGTQAAAEALLRQDVLAPVLRQATASDGSLRFFEVLLRSTSIESSAAGIQVIGFRIH
jgi:hypothetical protein